jgi:Cu(I)/Ag(I) efflux system membrane fusion protein
VRRCAVIALVGIGAAATVVGCRPASGPDGAVPEARPPVAAAATPRAAVTIDSRRRQLVGVKTTRAERGPAAAVVRATGTVSLPETKEAEISTKADGWVRGLKANYTGMTVRQGDALFVLYSPTLLAIENEFIAALHGRQQAEKSSVPEAREHAEQVIEIVRGRLLLLDVPVNEVRELERRGRALGEMTFLSPASGVIVQKDVVEGMHVAAGQRLFRVGDLSSVWIDAEVHERDLGAVATGQAATVSLDAFPGERMHARVAYIHTSVSERTRTLKVRLEMDNPGRRLKPGMSAAVTIAGTPRMALTVPIDAVIDSGTEQFVFLAEGDGYFEPRSVRTGRRFDGRVEVLDGLDDGQVVASGATFFIDSESQLKGALLNYAAQPGVAGASPPSSIRGAGVDIALRFQPDPPRAGTVAVAVTVTEAGRAVDAAEVHVVFSMPPMPSMGMGAMRSDARLSPAGAGRYTGSAEIPGRGRWDVAVAVSRDGRQIGSRQLAIVAR